MARKKLLTLKIAPIYFPDKIQNVNLDNNEERKLKDSFQAGFYPVLILAQCFGVMPVLGIKERCAKFLYFRYISFRFIYSILLIIGAIIMICFSLINLMTKRPEMKIIVSLVFYIINCITLILFIKLAIKWPKIMNKWELFERQLIKHNLPFRKRTIAWRIYFITIILMTMGLIEHVLSIFSNFYRLYNCAQFADNVPEKFFKLSFPQLFKLINYNHIIGTILLMMNYYWTFVWNFMDLFIIIISIGLSTYFDEINYGLRIFRGRTRPELYWMKYRILYTDLCNLIKYVDNAIGPIILLSFSNNLFFVCFQLYNSIDPIGDFSTMEELYFWFSTTYISLRTFAVSMYASKVYDSSKKPKDILLVLPSKSWCIEVGRFQEQIYCDINALSGMNFFYLRRGLFLKVAATLVTYELVLIQFHQASTDETFDPCK